MARRERLALPFNPVIPRHGQVAWRSLLLHLLGEQILEEFCRQFKFTVIQLSESPSFSHDKHKQSTERITISGLIVDVIRGTYRNFIYHVMT